MKKIDRKEILAILATGQIDRLKPVPRRWSMH